MINEEIKRKCEARVSFNERLVEMYRLKVNGWSYEDIGKKYDMSKQAVQQLLQMPFKKGNFLKYTHYKNLLYWIYDNGYSPSSFGRALGLAPETTRYKFSNGGQFTQNQLIKGCKMTGLTFEEIIEGENND